MNFNITSIYQPYTNPPRYLESVNQFNPQNEPTQEEFHTDTTAKVYYMCSQIAPFGATIRGITNGVEGDYYIDTHDIPPGIYHVSFYEYDYQLDYEYDPPAESWNVSCLLVSSSTPLPQPLSPNDLTNKKAYVNVFPVQWADDDDYKQCLLDFLNVIASSLINISIWQQVISQKNSTIDFSDLITELQNIVNALDTQSSPPIIINTEHDEPWRHV